MEDPGAEGRLNRYLSFLLMYAGTVFALTRFRASLFRANGKRLAASRYNAIPVKLRI
jgi:hypothetical protein